MAKAVKRFLMDQPQQQSEPNGQERILRNTSYLTVAFVVQKILSFFYFIVVARTIGPTDLGLYDPVKSIIPILLILIDFSLSAVLVREIARSPTRTSEYLNNVLGVKIIFTLIILTALGIFTNFSGYTNVAKSIIYTAGLVVALDTFSLTFYAVFRGLQNLKYEAIGMIINMLITMIAGIGALTLHFGLRALFLAIVCGSIFNFIYSITMLRLKLHIVPGLSWNKQTIKTFLRYAIPFAIAAIFTKIYTFTDRFTLLALAGQRYVGWYVTAHKLTYALEFIPSAFAAALYPAMSAFFVTNKQALGKTFERAMYYLMIIAVPISFGIFALADSIILTLYGPDFSTSIIPLRILIAGLTVIFLNFPVGTMLYATNRQVINTINIGITVLVNITLNFLLIPRYTFTGAAIAALVSGVLLFFLGLRWIGKIAPYNRKTLFITLGKTVGVSAVMAIGLFLLRNSFHVALLIGIGVIFYFVTLYAIRGFTKEDVRSLLVAVLRKKWV